MCNEIILPYQNTPFGSTSEKKLLGMLYSDELTHRWIYSQFINLYVMNTPNSKWSIKIFDSVFRNWQNVYFMDLNIINKKIIYKGWENFYDFVVDYIEKGYYLYFNSLDHYYLQPSRIYNQKHRLHGLVIYGFNKIKKLFYCSDYFFNLNNKFANSTITFNDFENSVKESFKIHHTLLRMNPEKFYILKINPTFREDLKNWDYMKKIKHRLLEYLDSSIYECNYRRVSDSILKQGICVNLFIVEKIKEILNFKFPSFNMFKSHKCCMYYRVQFLVKEGIIAPNSPIVDQIKKIFDLANIVEKLVMKYNFTKSQPILTRIQENILNINKLEESTLPQLLAIINK